MIKEKIYYIYKIENLISNKLYIGKHETVDINDRYFGSGIALKDSIKKYGKSNFRKSIIEFSTKDMIEKREIYWISELNTIVPNGYNISSGGSGGDNLTNHPRREEIIESMKGRAGRIFTKEEKQRISKRVLGSKLKPHMKVECEHCKKNISKANYKRWHGTYCKENPNMEIKDKIKIECEYCGISTNPTRFHIHHGKYCKENPNMEKKNKPDRIECEYCDRKVNNYNYLTFHGDACKKNPKFILDKTSLKETRGYKIGEKISKTRKNKGKEDSYETRIRKGLYNKGRIFSKETRKKMSETNKKRWENIRNSSNVYVCKNCNKSTISKGNYIRWHGDNCKMLKPPS